MRQIYTWILRATDSQIDQTERANQLLKSINGGPSTVDAVMSNVTLGAQEVIRVRRKQVSSVSVAEEEQQSAGN